MSTVETAYKQEMAEVLTAIRGSLLCSISTLEAGSEGDVEAATYALMGVTLLTERGLELLDLPDSEIAGADEMISAGNPAT